MKNFEIQLIRSVLHSLSNQGEAQLPGLGRLRVHSVSPAATSEQISPPQRSMVFEPNEAEGQNLSSFFVDHLGEDEADVSHSLSEYFDDLKTRVGEESVEWHGLGKFFKQGDQIQFQADDQWVNYINPGFEAVKRPAQEEKKAAIAAVPTVAAASSTRVNTPMVSTTSERESNRMGSSWIWVILSIGLCLVALILVASAINKKSKANKLAEANREQSTKSLVMTMDDSTSQDSYVHRVSMSEDTETLSSPVSTEEEETSTASSDEVTVDRVSEPVKEPVSKPEPMRTAPSSAKQCVLITGAFGNVANADKMKARLSQQFDLVYKKQHGNLYRVGVQCDCADAQSTLKTIKQKTDIDAWSFTLR